MTFPHKDSHDRGMETRRSVLGDDHVNQALAAETDLSADFQSYIVEAAWSAVWSRPGLDKRTRHLITIALLAGLGHQHELELHLRSIQNTSTSPEDVREALMHVAVYAGVPAANSAFALLNRIFGETPTKNHTDD